MNLRARSFPWPSKASTSLEERRMAYPPWTQAGIRRHFRVWLGPKLGRLPASSFTQTRSTRYPCRASLCAFESGLGAAESRKGNAIVIRRKRSEVRENESSPTFSRGQRQQGLKPKCFFKY